MDTTGALELPDDFTNEIPTSVLSWLLKAGVSYKIAQHYNFGWSPKLGRIVIPVFEDDQLIAVQSRAVYKDQKPKYLNKTGGPVKSPSFRSDDSIIIGKPIAPGTVITEDILSAVRVGRLMPARSTLGTHLSEKLVVGPIRSDSEPLFIWYDGDSAGIKGARKASKTLSLLGIEHRIIKTEHDPKDYNNDEIERIIQEAF